MALNYADLIDILSQMAGILPEYQAETGIFVTSTETKKALLKALNIPADTYLEALASYTNLQETPFLQTLPDVLVIRKSIGKVSIPVILPEQPKAETLLFEIVLEQGGKEAGCVQIAHLPVVETLEIKGKIRQRRLLEISVPEVYGYHCLTVLGAKMPLIVVPDKCYMPECITDSYRPWGFPLQLYALRSQNNWGIGDFSDLKAMVDLSSQFGASLIGINPINTLFATMPETASPYYSSSRLFLNPLYIDVMAITEASFCKDLKKFMSTNKFKERLEKARSSELVDYTAVSELKNKAFELLYADFSKNAPPKRQKAFDDFCKNGGQDLRNMAIYQSLAEHFFSKKIYGGFRSWGEAYATPDSQAVLAFAQKNKERLGYYMFLQFIAQEQFEKVSQQSKDKGLNIGLYQDLAVGVACESTETWSNQTLFPVDVSVGSPPDMFNPKGQEWGVAPMNPISMRQEGYASYIKILRANMENAGAVRIDHVMGLARLFCIPKGFTGAYVQFPFEDLVGIVALESHRNQCLVVGEDLGVVPSFFREALESAGILSFRVFRYQRSESDSCYLHPSEYLPLALVAGGTHDMPTLAGFWLGKDIEIAQKLGIFDDSSKVMNAFGARVWERRAIIEGLANVGRFFMSAEHFDDELYGNKLPDTLIREVYRYLASAPSCLFLPQLEDILEQDDQMNVPGTSHEYPNWRHKLSLTLEQMKTDPKMLEICKILRQERG